MLSFLLHPRLRGPALALILILGLTGSKPAAAVFAVYDAQNHQQQGQQLLRMAEQLHQLRAQLQQAQALTQHAKQQLEAVTGCRNLGQLLHQPALYQALPPQWQQFYDHGADIHQTIEAILSREQLQGEVAQLLPLLEPHRRHTVAGQMALNAQAYEIADQRIAQLERLLHQIDQTRDLKASSDLQSRIAIEQALIQNDVTKIQLAHQWQRQQLELIHQHQHQVSQRILNPANTAMPKLRSRAVHQTAGHFQRYR